MTCGKYWEGRVEAGLARPPPGRGHRADERILYGEAEVTVRDAAALLRLQREIDREAACQAAGTTAQWQAALREVLWVARRHLGEHWKPARPARSRSLPPAQTSRNYRGGCGGQAESQVSRDNYFCCSN